MQKNVLQLLIHLMAKLCLKEVNQAAYGLINDQSNAFFSSIGVSYVRVKFVRGKGYMS